MAGSGTGSKPRVPRELRERAVRLVFETAEEAGGQLGAVAKVARTLGVNRETLRRWVRQAEIDAGQRAGLTREERARLGALEREVKELRRANEILKAASTFFAAELDRHTQR
jgi:transposase